MGIDGQPAEVLERLIPKPPDPAYFNQPSDSSNFIRCDYAISPSASSS
jgi:hypothetical protein